MSSKPFKEVAGDYLPKVVFAFGYTFIAAVVLHVPFGYIGSYCATEANTGFSTVLYVSAVNVLILIGGIIVFPRVADNHGRKTMTLAGLSGCLILAVPAFIVTAYGSVLSVFVAQLILTLPAIFVMAPYSAIVIEGFPTGIRVSGDTPGNAAIALSGTGTSIVMTYLLRWTGWSAAPGILLAVAALIGIGLVNPLRDRWREPLPD